MECRHERMLFTWATVSESLLEHGQVWLLSSALADMLIVGFLVHLVRCNTFEKSGYTFSKARHHSYALRGDSAVTTTLSSTGSSG